MFSSLRGNARSNKNNDLRHNEQINNKQDLEKKVNNSKNGIQQHKEKEKTTLALSGNNAWGNASLYNNIFQGQNKYKKRRQLTGGKGHKSIRYIHKFISRRSDKISSGQQDGNVPKSSFRPNNKQSRAGRYSNKQGKDTFNKQSE